MRRKKTPIHHISIKVNNSTLINKPKLLYKQTYNKFLNNNDKVNLNDIKTTVNFSYIRSLQ